MKHQADVVTAVSELGDRLESWKEIAAYLNRGVSTVQRWEREEGLPAHRQQHDSLGSVYAYKHELEAWRANRTRLAPDEVSSPVRSWKPKPRAIQVGVLVAALAVAAFVTSRFTTTAPLRTVRRLTIVPSVESPFAINGTDRNLAITPDGTRVVYVGGVGGSRIFVRALDSLEALPVGGIGSRRQPFVSPDSRWIGFLESGALKKVAVTGGPTLLIADSGTMKGAGESAAAAGESWGAGNQMAFAVEGRVFRGASWSSDNQIVFGMEGRLFHVSADGGEPEPLVAPDASKREALYCWPEFIHGTSALLFTIMPMGDWSEKGSRDSLKSAQVAVLDLRTGQRKILLEGATHAHYVETGHLVYAAGDQLWAVPFDVRRLAVMGKPKVVVPRLATTLKGAADFDVAHDGTLVYVPGSIENDLVSLTWVDRFGHEELIDAPPFVYRYPRLSPDGQRLAFGSLRDLGVWDFSVRKLSWFGVGPASYPIWTPDGKRLIFASTRTLPIQMYSQSIDSTQPPTRLTTTAHNAFPNALSPTGSHLVFREDAETIDLMDLELRGAHSPQRLSQASSKALNADFSPDGKLLAYQSNESGQDEVYIEPFPNVVPPKRWTVSRGGGLMPRWARNGQELFYLAPNGAMMSDAVQQHGNTVMTGPPVKLFDGNYFSGAQAVAGRTYDISPNDGRFLMMKPVPTTPHVISGGNIEVVLNWFDELREVVGGRQ